MHTSMYLHLYFTYIFFPGRSGRNKKCTFAFFNASAPKTSFPALKSGELLRESSVAAILLLLQLLLQLLLLLLLLLVLPLSLLLLLLLLLLLVLGHS